MANNNGFPEHTIYRLKSKLLAKKDGRAQTQATEQYKRMCVIFAYHSPSIHKVTKLFKKKQLENKLMFHQHNMAASITKSNDVKPS